MENIPGKKAVSKYYSSSQEDETHSLCRPLSFIQEETFLLLFTSSGNEERNISSPSFH
jgi:hypothetical protein